MASLFSSVSSGWNPTALNNSNDTGYNPFYNNDLYYGLDNSLYDTMNKTMTQLIALLGTNKTDFMAQSDDVILSQLSSSRASLVAYVNNSIVSNMDLVSLITFSQSLDATAQTLGMGKSLFMPYEHSLLLGTYFEHMNTLIQKAFFTSASSSNIAGVGATTVIKSWLASQAHVFRMIKQGDTSSSDWAQVLQTMTWTDSAVQTLFTNIRTQSKITLAVSENNYTPSPNVYRNKLNDYCFTASYIESEKRAVWKSVTNQPNYMDPLIQPEFIDAFANQSSLIETVIAAKISGFYDSSYSTFYDSLTSVSLPTLTQARIDASGNVSTEYTLDSSSNQVAQNEMRKIKGGIDGISTSSLGDTVLTLLQYFWMCNSNQCRAIYSDDGNTTTLLTGYYDLLTSLQTSSWGSLSTMYPVAAAVHCLRFYTLIQEIKTSCLALTDLLDQRMSIQERMTTTWKVTRNGTLVYFPRNDGDISIPTIGTVTDFYLQDGLGYYMSTSNNALYFSPTPNQWRLASKTRLYDKTSGWSLQTDSSACIPYVTSAKTLDSLQCDMIGVTGKGPLVTIRSATTDLPIRLDSYQVAVQPDPGLLSSTDPVVVVDAPLNSTFSVGFDFTVDASASSALQISSSQQSVSFEMMGKTSYVTSAFKFGSSSLYFPSSTSPASYVRVGVSTDFTSSTFAGDWTIEFWINPSLTVKTMMPILAVVDPSAPLLTNYLLVSLTNYRLELAVSTTGVNYNNLLWDFDSGSNSPTVIKSTTTRQWNHFAIVWNSAQSSIYTYWGGTRIHNYVLKNPIPSSVLTHGFYIGMWPSKPGGTTSHLSSSLLVDSYIDTLMVSRLARYTKASFTVPTSVLLEDRYTAYINTLESTTTTSSVMDCVPITTDGNVQLVANNSGCIFGSSLYFPSNGGNRAKLHALPSWFTGSWTLEFFYNNVSENPSYFEPLITLTNPSTNSTLTHLVLANYMGYFQLGVSGNGIIMDTSKTPSQQGTWDQWQSTTQTYLNGTGVNVVHQIALCWDSTAKILYVYLDADCVFTISMKTATIPSAVFGKGCNLGYWPEGPNDTVVNDYCLRDAFLDEIRISTTVRYSQKRRTNPTTVFSSSTVDKSTVYLTHMDNATMTTADLCVLSVASPTQQYTLWLTDCYTRFRWCSGQTNTMTTIADNLTIPSTTGTGSFSLTVQNNVLTMKVLRSSTTQTVTQKLSNTPSFEMATLTTPVSENIPLAMSSLVYNTYTSSALGKFSLITTTPGSTVSLTSSKFSLGITPVKGSAFSISVQNSSNQTISTLQYSTSNVLTVKADINATTYTTVTLSSSTSKILIFRYEPGRLKVFETGVLVKTFLGLDASENATKITITGKATAPTTLLMLTDLEPTPMILMQRAEDTIDLSGTRVYNSPTTPYTWYQDGGSHFTTSDDINTMCGTLYNSYTLLDGSLTSLVTTPLGIQDVLTTYKNNPLIGPLLADFTLQAILNVSVYGGNTVGFLNATNVLLTELNTCVKEITSEWTDIPPLTTLGSLSTIVQNASTGPASTSTYSSQGTNVVY